MIINQLLTISVTDSINCNYSRKYAILAMEALGQKIASLPFCVSTAAFHPRLEDPQWAHTRR